MEQVFLWKYNFIEKSVDSIKLQSAVMDLNEMISNFPPGVFTTIRTNNRTHALQLSAHFQRMSESINLSGFEFHYSLDDLRPILRNLLKDQKGNEHRIRFHIPLNDLSVCYIFIEEFTPYSKEYYQKGVSVRTNNLSRVNPQAKLSGFLTQSLEEKQLLGKIGLEESLILDENKFILEGLSSNFFGIKENQVWTAENNILNGITRKIVLAEALNLGLEIRLVPINLNEISELHEAFITSTSRKVMPVIQIDSKIIGDGKPGPITNQLGKAFNTRFLKEFERI